MDFHFISGLPRSGSTLLAAVLRQNPRFDACFMTPLGHLYTNVLEGLDAKNEAYRLLTDEKREAVLKGLFQSFYAQHVAASDVVFDNNRRWLANLPTLVSLFPACRVLVPVRSPAAIVDSFERLWAANPYRTSIILGCEANTTVYDRVNTLMSKNGVIGFALNALRTAFYGPLSDRLVLVPYDDLARFPDRMLEHIHHKLMLEPFKYDFSNVQQIPGAAEFDDQLGAPGLHSVKPKFAYEQRKSVLPPDLYQGLPPPFWQNNLPTKSIKSPVTLKG